MGTLERAIEKLSKDGGRIPAPVQSPSSSLRAPPEPGRGALRAAKSIGIENEVLAANGLIPPRDSANVIAEQFRAVKRPLIGNALSTEPGRSRNANVLMVTSAQKGEGKTFCSFNLAVSVAREKDVPVLLIDGDVLSPKLSTALTLGNQQGLIDYLNDPSLSIDDILVELPDLGVTFLSAGSANPHAHELLASRRMAALVRELSDRHAGMIIIDSPPLLGTNEAKVISGHAGQYLLVVAAGRTRQSATLEAASMLDESKPLNLVLNQCPGNATRYTYGPYAQPERS